MRNSHSSWIAIGMLIAAGLACGGLKDAKPLADSGVVEFHSRLNEGKYDEIYDSSNKAFRDASSREDLTKLLSAVRSKLGPVVDSKSQSWRVGNFNLTTTVALVQETTFESGKATEEFVFVIEDSNATLLSYNVNSNDLITK